MKIAVFGSTGPSGQLFIKYALEQGHSVNAFARNPSKINLLNNNLEIIKSDLNDIQAIGQAITGVDAVVSLMGPLGNDKRNSELGDGYINIIDAMKKNYVNRIIALGTASIKAEEDRPVFKFRFLVAMVRRIIPGSYNEIVRIGNIVRNSGLDWTLVRVAILTDRNAGGEIRTGYYGRGKLRMTISRADLAKYFVTQLEDRTYIRKAPAVSN